MGLKLQSPFNLKIKFKKCIIMIFSEFTRNRRKLNDFNTLKKNIKELVNDKKIMMLLSGGKDSATALSILKELDLNVELCVHFYHDWSWDISKEEAKKIAESFNIPIKFYYIGDDLRRRTKNCWGRNICKICKEIMKKKYIEIAKEKNIEIIANGDTAVERISGPIMEYLTKNNLNFNKMELTPVPEKAGNHDLLFLRPLIRIRYGDVDRVARYYDINVKRAGEANFKLREGCPVQYLNPDAKVNEELLHETYDVNKIVTGVARNHGFKASIFMPSLAVAILPEKDEHFNLIKDTLVKIGYNPQKITRIVYNHMPTEEV